MSIAREKFLDERGEMCPVCEEYDTRPDDYGIPQRMDDTVYIDMCCDQCHAKWEMVFVLHGYDELRHPVWPEKGKSVVREAL